MSHLLKNIIKCIINCLRLTKRNFVGRRQKKLIKPNKRFKNAFRGKRCFILGNGPSLKNVDFSLLENEYVFTVNQIARNPNFYKLKSNFHFWADYRFFDLDLQKEGDRQLFDSMLAVNSGNKNVEVFYEMSALDLNKRNGVEERLKVNYFSQENLYVEPFLAHRDFDLSKIVPAFPTVVQTCIMAAIYMGFKEIVLLGCDCTSVFNIIQSRTETKASSAYAYSVSAAEKKRMEEVSKKTSIADELIWQGQLFKTYDLLDGFCKKKGVRLLNATDGSLIETIEKVDLKDLLKNER